MIEAIDKFQTDFALTHERLELITARLRELVRDKFLEQNGKARSTWYQLKA